MGRATKGLASCGCNTAEVSLSTHSGQSAGKSKQMQRCHSGCIFSLVGLGCGLWFFFPSCYSTLCFTRSTICGFLGSKGHPCLCLWTWELCMALGLSRKVRAHCSPAVCVQCTALLRSQLQHKQFALKSKTEMPNSGGALGGPPGFEPLVKGCACARVMVVVVMRGARKALSWHKHLFFHHLMHHFHFHLILLLSFSGDVQVSPTQSLERLQKHTDYEPTQTLSAVFP